MRFGANSRRRGVRLAVVLSAMCALGSCASEPLFTSLNFQTAPEGPPNQTPMREETHYAPPPAGFLSFCTRYPDQCAQPAKAISTIEITPNNWAALNRINRAINQLIIPESDLEHYDRAEYWTIPADGLGVCHDYAIVKRKALIDAGFPELALRIAIVLTHSGAHHVVLTVTTDRGDFVLDNLSDSIRGWADTDYVWLERQASTSAWSWVGLAKGYDLNASVVTGSTIPKATSRGSNLPQ